MSGHRYAAASLGGRQGLDLALWLVGSRLAAHDVATGGAPNSKQRALFRTALLAWLAASEDHALSASLLQLLTLALCMPSAGELREGEAEAVEFVAAAVAAVAKAARCTPGRITFAEAQLCSLLTGALCGV